MKKKRENFKTVGRREEEGCQEKERELKQRTFDVQFFRVE